jgi:hypothetical protein
MKEALGLCTFAVGVLCFVAFLTVLKPHGISAVRGLASAERCEAEPRSAPWCGKQAISEGQWSLSHNASP